MIPLEEAQKIILDSIKPLTAGSVKLPLAAGRFLAGPVISRVDLPPGDNSAMDGYAVRSADLAHASVEKPVVLSLTAESAAGKPAAVCLEPGRCARIFTGAILPEGADAVVMQEDVSATLKEPIQVRFVEPVKPWENIRFRGEDLKAGTVMAETGDKITPQLTGLLAAAGVDTIKAPAVPSMALIATGDELIEPPARLEPGCIFESNRASLAALANSVGINTTKSWIPLVPDDLKITTRAIKRAMEDFDVIVTIGGASVGDRDWVKQAMEKAGVKMNLWKVEIRPGKPFAFGHRKNQLFFALPGNPVSALVTFYLLVRPALLKLQGARDVHPPFTFGTLAEPLENPGDRRHFVRVIIDNDGRVKLSGTQASHIMVSLARSHGLVDVPPRTTLESGSMVKVLLWT